jgi:hypothetical protein
MLETDSGSRTLRALELIRKAGYSVYLVADRAGRDQEEPAALPVALATPRSDKVDPVFKIDGRDLSFLRALGIDPTRKMRRRR